AFFGLKGTGTANISVLDKDGNELALGAGCKEDGCKNVANCLGNTAAGADTTPPATGGTNAPVSNAAAGGTNAPSGGNNTGGGTKPLNTGVGGVMALGGMAVLATGAVIISRKRK
ncbi:MAG: hypothetical protein FWG33_04345, partial [Oscillospiraceae bacterium]|nr:hypothetical protein [Oscillospiraceae bacterium]